MISKIKYIYADSCYKSILLTCLSQLSLKQLDHFCNFFFSFVYPIDNPKPLRQKT